MRRADAPDLNSNDDDDDNRQRRCAADGCIEEGAYPAPKSRSALRDYLWFCLEHVREYNKSWNYYEGLQGAALEGLEFVREVLLHSIADTPTSTFVA